LMKKIVLFFLLLCSVSAAQNYSDSLRQIENDFKSFRYEEVIKSSENLLEINTIPSGVKTELLMMKGISHFVILEDTLAKQSFLEILKIDPSYFPDTIITSPKIIKFFNDIRENYAWYYTPQDTVLQMEQEIKPSAVDSMKLYSRTFRGSVVRSLLLPGLGHLYLDQEIGWYLTIPAGISFITSVYYIFDTNNRREDYLHSQDPDEISEKYKEYNSSYKVRNVSIIIFSAIWLFSQFDILTSEYIIPSSSPSININPSDKSVNISLKINF
jgi:hypothetical protein